MANLFEIEKPVIFFDGVCNLCNGLVDFVIKRDKKKSFYFAPLQGATASLLPGEISTNTDSLLLLLKGKIYTRSSAALIIAKHLDGLWPLIYGLIIIPPFVRNFVYDNVARYRYKLFGKKDQCRLPTPDLAARFLK